MCLPFFQFSAVTQSCLTLCNPIDCSTPGFPVHHQLQELTQTHVHQVSDVIQPSHPLSSPLLLPSTFASISVFSNESGGQSIGAAASASVLPMNIQWFPLSLTGLISLQSKGLSRVFFNREASIFQDSTFFTVQLSYPYMTTGKTIALTRWTFVGKVMSLLLIMLSSFVKAFLPRHSSSVSHSVVSNSLQPHGLWPTRLLCPWGSLGKNIGVDCHSLLQRLFRTQGLNSGLLHCRQILYLLNYSQCLLISWLQSPSAVILKPKKIKFPLPFLNPAWTSRSSQFMYCWSLAWRVLSITLLSCEMSAIVW